MHGFDRHHLPYFGLVRSINHLITALLVRHEILSLSQREDEPMDLRPNLTAITMTAALCLMSSAASASPAIFWASDPVGPDETVQIIGDGLEEIDSVRVRRLRDDQTAGTAPGWSSVEPLQQNGQALKFIIPSSIGAGVYQYELVTGQGEAVRGDLNTPSVYWAQGDAGGSASRGGWIRLLGRNIARAQGAKLTLIGSEGQGTHQLNPRVWSLWDATFDLPRDLPLGEYSLRLSNGNGTIESWRDVPSISLIEPEPPSDFVLDVKKAGAKGDGNTDDTMAIQGALQQLARRHGGTLFLPRGYYRLSAGLDIPNNVTLRGQSRELSRLVWKGLKSAPDALISGYSNFVLEDLTIYAAKHGHVISGGFPNAENHSNGRNIKIRRVTVRASNYSGHQTVTQIATQMQAALDEYKSARSPDTLRLAGENLVVEDSDFYGSGRSIFLMAPQNARIARNTFYNGRRGWYSITAPDRVIFENNRVIGADLQASGGSVNTLSAGAIAVSQNVLFLHNRFDLFSGWDREAMTSDGGGGCYQGGVLAGGGDQSFVLADPPGNGLRPLDECQGAGFVIVGGRGMGQFARIDDVDDNRIRLDRRLVVEPDSSSIVTIGPLQMNYLMIGNDFTDAGIAIQFYGSSINHVVAENKSTRTGGFANRGLLYQNGLQPSWYVQYLDNTIVESGVDKGSSIMTWAARMPDVPVSIVLGTIIRRNTLEENASIEVKGMPQENSGISDVVIEGNSISNVDRGVIVDAGAKRVLTQHNYFQEVDCKVQRSVQCLDN